MNTARGATAPIHIIGINNRPYYGEPQRSLAHAFVSGIAMAAFVVCGLLWVASI